jgi:T3SS negative regulator,GrlR
MLRNGSYSAWFRTRQEEGRCMMQGEGTGVIELNDGKVTGGDAVLAYTGSYVADGDKFTAFIATKRRTPGRPSVFGLGIDEVNLTLTGKSTPTTASCTGTAKQAPGLTFEATLVPMAD